MNSIISPTPQVSVKGNRKTAQQEEGRRKNSPDKCFVDDGCQMEVSRKTCSEDDVIMIDNSSGDEYDVEMKEPANHPQGNLTLFPFF